MVEFTGCDSIKRYGTSFSSFLCVFAIKDIACALIFEGDNHCSMVARMSCYTLPKRFHFRRDGLLNTLKKVIVKTGNKDEDES